MKTITIVPIATLTAAALLAPVLALAQAQPSTDTTKPNTPAQQQPQQAQQQTPQQGQQASQDKKKDQPPKLEKLEEGEPSSLKIGKPGPQQKVTETRDDSGVKEVKVQTGVSTYYVKPNQDVGNSLPGDVQSVHNHGAEWKVFEFDLGSKNKNTDKTTDTGAAPPKDGSVTDEPPKK
jgi:hypothetical protein